jgi:hypothetical protein
VKALALVVAAAACHHASSPPPVSPDYTPVAGAPIPARGQLYADCLGDALSNKRIAYAHDSDTDLLLFTCNADPAHAFFDGLAGKGAEVMTGATTLRSTNPVRHDLFGVDYCTHANADYACVITLNAGRFLR